MFCKSCGKEINDNAVVCPFCGCQTGVPQQPYAQQNVYQNQYPQQQGGDEINVGLVILSIFIPIVGIILGAVNISNGKKKSGKAYLTAGIIVAAIGIVISIIGAIIAATNPAVQFAYWLGA